jgi:chromosome segregation protein
MRLNRLEIAGFKSFADRSELAFDTGVTAIVGPNGCGKSNVVDAITWVLGEQSAKSLRGEHMQDIIFQGSDSRKSTSAAEVRLRLSGVASRVPGNGSVRPGASLARRDPRRGRRGELTAPLDPLATLDVESLIVRDVELSRRLYRSGESEYLIDGEVVRLKDVQDLLMDADVGVKPTRSSSRGKIGPDSQRPPDRSPSVDREAAGHHELQVAPARRGAQARSGAAEPTRVDDIIFEVEKQRGSLKRRRQRRADTSACARSCGVGRRCRSRSAIACWRRHRSERGPGSADARARENRPPGASRRGREHAGSGCGSS